MVYLYDQGVVQKGAKKLLIWFNVALAICFIAGLLMLRIILT